MNWNVYTVWIWLLNSTLFASHVQSSGLFELRIRYFNNDSGKDSTGACCSGRINKTTGKCSGTCRTRFRICLKHYQAKIDTKSPCTFGDVITPVLGENTFNLTYVQNQQMSNAQAINSIRFPFDFTWPGTFTLILEAWHDTNDSDSRAPGVLISRLPIQRVLDVSDEWTGDKYESAHSFIQYDFRVTCDSHYYGAGCTNLCRPRDDSFGHYTCSATGQIVCLSGWQGDYCTKARCLQGCNEQHGHCNKPNECLCQLGWKGTLCDECEPYPGCNHGTCKKPWECHCNEGWGGLFCNQDLNYCTNHRPCQNGGTCFNTGQGLYTCKCPPGFAGTDCEITSSDCANSPCLNSGTCHENSENQTYVCECPKSWTGRHCEVKSIMCADKPCLHGKCRDTMSGFKCECPIGYSGDKCELQIDDCKPNPCSNNGTCINMGNSYRCICLSGFSGGQCHNNIDDCKGNPCLNGGTCVDMVNQFRCQCVPGYIGSLCSSKVDLCLTKPCANGGVCTNLNNDYSCICRPGFTGKDCSIDIDECSSMPCRNGGTCVNRVNSFLCVCPEGYRGSDCGEESYSATFDARQLHTSKFPDENGGLTSGQVILIAILSVAMPFVAVVAACIVICMKRKQKRAQEKDDAEARKQNEQNATTNLTQGNSVSSKRSSTSGLTFDTANPTIIKNTWDKSGNNISSSASVDECLMNSSVYGAIAGYSENSLSGDCFISVPLQRAKSQKQLNTDPSVVHRTPHQLVTTSKEYVLENKRLSLLSDAAYSCPRWVSSKTQVGSSSGTSSGSGLGAVAVANVPVSTTSQRPVRSPPHI